MVSHNGGSNNLAAVQENLWKLLSVGFSLAQVVKMSSHGGGSKNIAAVLTSLSPLKVWSYMTCMC